MNWFEPEGATWHYVSHRLTLVRVISLWITLAIIIGVLMTLGAVVTNWIFVGAGAVALVGLWSTWVIWRQVTAHAWAEREDDLLVKRGRMFRAITVVPYGRMQYVEVEAGPLARAFGIARVQLHTASPGTDASISGVPVAEAARLRDRLTERGEATLAGL
jgi:membrane protein YdbS with pleckstrin-like domain